MSKYAACSWENYAAYRELEVEQCVAILGTFTAVCDELHESGYTLTAKSLLCTSVQHQSPSSICFCARHS